MGKYHSRKRKGLYLKNKVVAGLLALFAGGFGLHKFYLGKIGHGIVYLLFFWTFIPALFAFFEGLILLLMTKEEFDHKYNFHIPEKRKDNFAYGDNGNYSTTPASDDKYDLLERLGKMRDKGLITDDEFELEKSKIMGYLDN